MPSGNPRILIVDDEPSIMKMLGIVFQRAGYDVRVASNAREAMEICQTESFDVLLSDIIMPGMTGHELARWLVKRSPGVQRILMSGFDGAGCEGCNQAPTACTILRKPFLPQAALAAVDDLLATSKC